MVSWTTRKDNLSGAVDAGNQQAVLQLQIHNRYTDNRRILSDAELDGFHAVVKQVVQRFDIAADGVLTRAHIGDNGFRRDVLRIDNAAQLQPVDDVIEGDAVEFW